LNREKIWKIWKLNKLKSEKKGKIWKKGKLNSEKIWNRVKKRRLNSEEIWKYGRKVRFFLHIFPIFSLLNLPFFHIFTIQLTFFHISICFHYSTYFSSIFSVSFHYSASVILYYLKVF
jgi:hypothetical protein